MFEEFFHLRENPFALAPNPRFIFQSHEHVEALAHFRYWIENGEGFVLITGEVGTGKTTALFDLMAQLPNDWSVGFVANSSLAAHELLEEVCRRFRIEIPAGATRPTLLARLENYLAEREDHGLRSLLILDEAQNFETRLLEEVRLLSNLERATGKLLQIALVGQPELDRKLELPELRQLRQRIGIRYRLGPLSEEECVGYIHHRVSVAGGDAAHIFPVETGLAVYRLTHGIPREINVVASQALISAFVQGAESVRPDHVQAVVEEFNWSSIFGREVPAPRPRKPRMSEGPALGAGLAPRLSGLGMPAASGPPPTGGSRPSSPPPAASPALPAGAIGGRELLPQAPAGPNPPLTPASPSPFNQPRTPPTPVDPIRPRPALEVVRGRGAERNSLDPHPAVEPAGGLVGEVPSARAEIPILRSEPEPVHRPDAFHRPEPAPRPEPLHRSEPPRPESALRPESGLRSEQAAPVLRPRPPAETPRRPVLLAEPEPQRRPWLWIAGIALVLALFVVGSFWLKGQSVTRSHPKPRPPRTTEAAPAPTPGGAVAGEPAPAAPAEQAPPSEQGSSEVSAKNRRANDGARVADGSPPPARGTQSAAAKAPPAKRGTAATGAAAAPPRSAPAEETAPPATAGGRAEAPSSADLPASTGPEYAILAASFVGDAGRVAEVRREYEVQFGLPVAIVRVDWGSGQWRNRVYVGSYPTRDAAERVRRVFVAEGRLPGDTAVRSFANATEGVPAP